MKCPKNKKLKDGKCKPKRKKFFSKTSKNPFKMIGGYLGALMGLYLYPSIKVGISLGNLSDPFIGGFLNGFTWFVGRATIKTLTMHSLIGISLGFLAGYGIQLLIRKFRK